MASPTVFPRFSACFDEATAAAIRREASARLERPADLIRTAVENELRVREAARAAVAAELARQDHTARSLARLIETGPGAVSARVAAQVAAAARPAGGIVTEMQALADRARAGRPSIRRSPE